MSLRLGRCIITDDDIEAWQQSGDRVRIGGYLLDTTASATKQKRQQLLGYQNNLDEPIIPVVWTEDSSVTGWYRILDVNVDALATAFVDGTAGWRYSVDMERITGFASPALESVVRGALRVNGHSITAGTSIPWHAVEDATAYYDAGVAVTTAGRGGENGTILLVSGGSNVLYDAVVRHSIDAANAYLHAATIEVGSSLAPVVGRQITNEPANWRLSNGILRVTPVGTTSKLDISAYDGTQWDTPQRFRLGHYVAGISQFAEWTSITVLRNTPELVVIRLTTTNVPRDQQFTVDLALRRGARTVSVHYGARYGTFKWAAQDDNLAASTALTGGIRRTSNDADGNRFVITTAGAATNTLASGLTYYTTGVVQGDAAIGLEVGGSSATGLETAQSLIYQWMAAQSERQVAALR